MATVQLVAMVRAAATDRVEATDRVAGQPAVAMVPRGEGMLDRFDGSAPAYTITYTQTSPVALPTARQGGDRAVCILRAMGVPGADHRVLPTIAVIPAEDRPAVDRQEVDRQEVMFLPTVPEAMEAQAPIAAVVLALTEAAARGR